ncbi:MAG: molybdopterin molybdotransferase MoeA [Gemmata sp.]
MSEPNEAPKPAFTDVRMRGFRERAGADTVLALLDRRLTPLGSERVPLPEAAGRVLAAPVHSGVDVPPFPKAAMDGFAVRAADLAAGVPLAVVGEAFPARPFAGEVARGHAVRITTGAPIPAGADAVLMAECAAAHADGHISATAPVPPGKHIVRVGEDVARGREVLPGGRVLRPQDVGLLAATGAGAVPVVRRPRVALVVTGNELLPPGAAPEGFRIVDSNSPMLAALAARDGATVPHVRYAPDTYDAVRASILEATESADLVLVSGGTSVGTEDHAPRAAADLGDLAVHGVAVRPAGPLGVAFVGAACVFLIPGSPVSCLCAYDLFAGRAVRRLGGRAWALPHPRVTLPVAERIGSAVGRVDYARVRRVNGGIAPVAGGASGLSGAVAADGFVLVPADRARLEPGEPAEVHLYDA